MKFKDGGLAGRVARERQHIADGIIAISNRVAAVCHSSNESPKFVVAITDSTAKSLLSNRE
jgi:hypothetical protein